MRHTTSSNPQLVVVRIYIWREFDYFKQQSLTTIILMEFTFTQYGPLYPSFPVLSLALSLSYIPSLIQASINSGSNYLDRSEAPPTRHPSPIARPMDDSLSLCVRSNYPSTNNPSPERYCQSRTNFNWILLIVFTMATFSHVIKFFFLQSSMVVGWMSQARGSERQKERKRLNKGQTLLFTLGLIQFHPQRNHLMPYILFKQGFHGLQ